VIHPTGALVGYEVSLAVACADFVSWWCWPRLGGSHRSAPVIRLRATYTQRSEAMRLGDAGSMRAACR